MKPVVDRSIHGSPCSNTIYDSRIHIYQPNQGCQVFETSPLTFLV